MAKVEIMQIEDGWIVYSPKKEEQVFLEKESYALVLTKILSGMTQKTADTCLLILSEDPFVKLKLQESGESNN